VARYVKSLSKDKLQEYEKKAETEVKTGPGEATQANPDSQKESSTPAKATTGKTSSRDRTRTDPETPTPGQVAGRSIVSGGFRRSTILLGSSSASSKDEHDGNGASDRDSSMAPPQQTPPVNNADTLKALKQVQWYKDRFARATALAVGYVNDSKEIFHQTHGLNFENIKDLGGENSETVKTMRRDSKAFAKHIVKRTDGYAEAFLTETNELAAPMDNSAYDLEATQIRSFGEPTKVIESSRCRDTLPLSMPALEHARAKWSGRNIKYLSNEGIASTEAYRQLADGHLKNKNSVFYRRRQESTRMRTRPPLTARHSPVRYVKLPFLLSLVSNKRQ
tara:strand:- start:8110 stop:9114 length:1005 start_codon:yes stop_codon:yes gene_type:complete